MQDAVDVDHEPPAVIRDIQVQDYALGRLAVLAVILDIDFAKELGLGGDLGQDAGLGVEVAVKQLQDDESLVVDVGDRRPVARDRRLGPAEVVPATVEGHRHPLLGVDIVVVDVAVELEEDPAVREGVGVQGVQVAGVRDAVDRLASGPGIQARDGSVEDVDVLQDLVVEEEVTEGLEVVDVLATLLDPVELRREGGLKGDEATVEVPVTRIHRNRRRHGPRRLDGHAAAGIRVTARDDRCRAVGRGLGATGEDHHAHGRSK
ncbi:hypothetical protein D3C87_687890 [compost metagenome]